MGFYKKCTKNIFYKNLFQEHSERFLEYVKSRDYDLHTVQETSSIHL